MREKAAEVTAPPSRCFQPPARVHRQRPVGAGREALVIASRKKVRVLVNDDASSSISGSVGTRSIKSEYAIGSLMPGLGMSGLIVLSRGLERPAKRLLAARRFFRSRCFLFIQPSALRLFFPYAGDILPVLDYEITTVSNRDYRAAGCA